MSSPDLEPKVPAGAVVVGYEETAVAGYALDWAADQAAREGRPLVVVHATGSPGTAGDRAETERRELLATAIARVAERQPTVRAVPLVAVADAARELVRLSRRAALVVVGSRGHGIGRSVATGHVGTGLARSASCPVAVIPDHDLGTVRQGVLAGVRLSEETDAVLEFAHHFASSRGLPLTVAHATGHRSDTEKEELRQALAEASSALGARYPDVWVHHLVIPGRPAHRLLEMAERMDLLVVGQHHPTGLQHSPFGHVRSSVVDRSTCPTVVVPLRVAEPAR